MENEKKLYTEESKIPASEFELVHNDENLHDTKFETRPIGWFEDSVRRFARNKASVVGFILIAILTLFSIIVPIISPFNYYSKSEFPDGFRDVHYRDCAPKLFDNAGGFWDGTLKKSLGEVDYQVKVNSDANSPYVIGTPKIIEDQIGSTIYKTYVTRIDTYAVGTAVVEMYDDMFNDIQAYEASKNITFTLDNMHKSILKPQIDYADYVKGEMKDKLVAAGAANVSNIIDQAINFYEHNGSVYYKIFPTKKGNGYSDTQFQPVFEDGNVVDLYVRDADNKLVFRYTDTRNVRVDYNAYFKFKYGKSVRYVFGANLEGRDLLTRLAEGGRFSLLLGIGITLINFIIGLIWGAISGYYGGTADLIMERIVDIIANIPTIIVMSLCSIQFTNNVQLKAALGPSGIVILAILIAFVYNGWVGVAGRTRMQFYRFKGQEYVLASRTLGAKDRRLIFKHILPNAAGTLVTSCVLMIPGIIFAESSLSYLGIIDFRGSGIVSIGALLDEGNQAGIKTYPYLLLFPAIVVSILMVSYNLFGNGLRDAFNTTLRGSED